MFAGRLSMNRKLWLWSAQLAGSVCKQSVLHGFIWSVKRGAIKVRYAFVNVTPRCHLRLSFTPVEERPPLYQYPLYSFTIITAILTFFLYLSLFLCSFFLSPFFTSWHFVRKGWYASLYDAHWLTLDHSVGVKGGAGLCRTCREEVETYIHGRTRRPLPAIWSADVFSFMFTF